MVERRWRAVWKSEEEISVEDPVKETVFSSLPTDSEIASAFSERRRREGSLRGYGLRVTQSTKGSDSWVDDPIMRHIIGVYVNKEEEGDESLIWPLVLHVKGSFSILVLPLVEPKHLKAYARLCKRSDCGNAIIKEESLSSLLLDLPSITGYGLAWWHVLLVT